MSTFYAYSEGDSAPYPINHLVDPYEEHSLNYFKMVTAICKYAARNNIGIVIERYDEADKKLASTKTVFIPNETLMQYGNWYSLKEDDIPFPNLQKVITQIEAIEFLKGD